MHHLFKSELVRFRNLTLAFAIAHLLILRGVSAFGDLFAMTTGKLVAGVLIYALTGLILGLYQLGSYKKLKSWTYLIHRPLAPSRIFAALSGAAATLLFAAIALPILVMTLYLEVMTVQWIDFRQYLLPIFVFAMTYCLYLIGCFVALSASRAAVLVLALPFLFMTRQAVGLWVFLPQLFVLLWLGFVAFVVFKPNLSTHLRRPVAVVASALPIQYAFFGLILMGVMVANSTVTAFQVAGWKSFAVHRWDNYFPDGTFFNAQYRQDEEVIAHGLRTSTTERSRHLQKQVELAEVSAIRPWYSRFPVRHQLAFMDDQTTLNDGEENVVWTFSHDRMAFQGRETLSGARVGWLGPDGRSDTAAAVSRFPEVPFLVGDRFLVTHRELYEFDARRQRVTLRYELADGEVFVSPLVVQGSFATALSDRALYFFEPRDLRDEPGLLTPFSVVPLPGEARNLDRIHVAELIDGYLLSFLFGTQSEREFHEAKQIVAELGVDGSYEVVNERALGPGWPAWFSHRGFVVSPLLQYAHDVVWTAIAPLRPQRVTVSEILARPIPAGAGGTALLVAILSAVLTAWVARRRRLERRIALALDRRGFRTEQSGLFQFPFPDRSHRAWKRGESRALLPGAVFERGVVMRRNLVAISLLLVCSAALAAPRPDKKVAQDVATSTESWIDIELFLTKARIRQVVLSPAGDHVAYLLREPYGASLWTLDPATGERDKRLESQRVDDMEWSTDGAGLFVESGARIAYVSADGERASFVLKLDDLREQEYFGVDPIAPRHVLVTEKSGDEEYRLLRIDAAGEAAVVYTSSEPIPFFLLDGRGEVAFVKGVVGRQHVVYRVLGGERRELLRCNVVDLCRPIAASEDGRRLYLLGYLGGDRRRLAAIDTTTGEIETVHEDPNGLADLSSITFDPVNRQPLFAIYHTEERRSYSLDAERGADLPRVEARFPQKDLQIDASSSGRYWLVTETGARLQRPRYHLYDVEEKTYGTILENEQESEIAADLLVEKRFLSYRAGDGMLVHGWVSVPRGVNLRTTPAVALVHGGPWNHVRSGYNGFAQFLVSRGYVVFEPNFRGSTGFGLTYMMAAKGQFGDGRVQQDIVDGMRHLVTEGIGDPERLAIVGHSFGGFSTLAGLAFTPDFFRAGVASAAPIDLARAMLDVNDNDITGNGLPLLEMAARADGRLRRRGRAQCHARDGSGTATQGRDATAARFRRRPRRENRRRARQELLPEPGRARPRRQFARRRRRRSQLPG